MAQAQGIAETMEQLLAGMRALVNERDALVAERDALEGKCIELADEVFRLNSATETVDQRMQKLSVAEADAESDEDVRGYVHVQPSLAVELPTAASSAACGAGEADAPAGEAARRAKRPRGDDALSAKLAAEISKELGEMEEKYRVEALQKVEDGKVRRSVVNIINGGSHTSASLCFANPVAAKIARGVYATLGLQCDIYGGSGLVITNAREWYDANK